MPNFTSDELFDICDAMKRHPRSVLHATCNKLLQKYFEQGEHIEALMQKVHISSSLWQEAIVEQRYIYSQLKIMGEEIARFNQSGSGEEWKNED